MGAGHARIPPGHRRAGGDCAVLRVTGEVDAYTAPMLRERIRELAAGGAVHLIADLGQVDFLDSTGLGALVGGLKRLREDGGSLALVITAPRILRIFQITGLTKVFATWPSVDRGHYRGPALAESQQKARPEASASGAASTAYPEAGRGGSVRPLAIARSLSGLASSWIAVMRPSATDIVTTATGWPPAVIIVPGVPLISAASMLIAAMSVPMYGRVAMPAMNRATLSAPVIGRNAAFALPPPSVSSVTLGASAASGPRCHRPRRRR